MPPHEPAATAVEAPPRHALLVRTTHWIAAVAVVTLAVSGVFILMVHPRLYWGEVGNDLVPSLLDLPISRNLNHGGWTAPTPLTASATGPVTASRTYEIFNQNGWARSLHFLAAWCLVLPGLLYVADGLTRGHFRSHLWPRRHELAQLGPELRDHARLRLPPAAGGPRYGLLQKAAYTLVVFAAAPLVVVTGLAMSPAVTASVPLLLDVFGGYQSSRTIHFVAFVTLALFLLVHVTMVAASGVGRHIRAMTIGE